MAIRADSQKDENSDLIFPGKNFHDIDKANKENKTAIFLVFKTVHQLKMT